MSGLLFVLFGILASIVFSQIVMYGEDKSYV